MNDLIRIDSHNTFSCHVEAASGTLESYIKNAYRKSFLIYNGSIPECFDVCEIVADDVNSSGRRFFDSCLYGFPQKRDEISVEFVEYALVKMSIEFINMQGEHIGCCQNILFEDW